MLKRILKELADFKVIQYEVIEDENKVYTLIFYNFNFKIVIPENYHFQAPHLKGIKHIKQRLDPQIWCLTLLSDTRLKKILRIYQYRRGS